MTARAFETMKTNKGRCEKESKDIIIEKNIAKQFLKKIKQTGYFKGQTLRFIN